MRRTGGGIGEFEIAIAGFGPVRADPEGDERAVLRCGLTFGHGGEERRHVADHVIGRRHQHQIVPRALRLKVQGCRQNRRGGVACGGFQKHRGRVDAQIAQLFERHEAEIRGRQHQRRGEARAPEALRAGLKQAFIPQQTGELLRKILA